MLQKTRPFVNLQGFLGHFVLLLLSFTMSEFFIKCWTWGTNAVESQDSADCL